MSPPPTFTSALVVAATQLFGDARIPYAVLLTDRHGRIRHASAASTRVLGRSPEWLQGRNWHALSQDDQVDLRTIGASGVQWVQPMEHTEIGQTWLECTVHAVDSADQGAELVWLLQDITARHSAELAHQSTLQTLFRVRTDLAESQRAARVGTWRWDIKADVVTWSDALYATYGVPLGTPMNFDSFKSRILPEDSRLVQDSIMRSLRTGRPYSFSHRVVRTDGTIRVVQGQGRVDMNDAGEPVELTGTCQDVTDLARAREAALAGARMKVEFLNGLSQDIRTPVQSIMGILDLLTDTPLDEEQIQLTELARGCCVALSTVMGGITDTAKLEAGKLVLHAEDFDLRRLLEQCMQTLQLHAGHKNLQLSAEMDPDVSTWLRGDPHRLRQILTNLANNAIHATHQGYVRIRVQQPLADATRVLLRFEVEDSGPGMPLAARQALVRMFEHADGFASGRLGGAGLGLTVAHRLAQLMDGDIGVTSQEGQGSTFCFTAQLQRANANVVPSHLPQQPLRGRVLIAEDNAINQVIAVKTLERFGCEARVASSGQEALDAVAEKDYDLVLMGCELPEMDGLEATRRIRARESQHGVPRTPIVALTSHVHSGEAVRCLEAGMDACISKPVDRAQLAGVLSRWLVHRAHLQPSYSETK